MPHTSILPTCPRNSRAEFWYWVRPDYRVNHLMAVGKIAVVQQFVELPNSPLQGFLPLGLGVRGHGHCWAEEKCGLNQSPV
jgi:hypothetical protein